MLKYSSDSLGYLKWGWLLYLSIVSLLPIVAWRSACPSGQAGLQLPRTAATNVSLDLNNVLKHQSYTITLTNLSRQWWTGNHHVQFLSLSWYYECFPSERVVWQQGRLRTHFVASPVHSSTLLSICPSPPVSLSKLGVCHLLLLWNITSYSLTSNNLNCPFY